MARADRRSAERASRAAYGGHGIRASGQARTVEQTLFFSKLRRNAKWVFLFLAIVFAVSFVAFGVGSNVQGGIADVIQGGASDTGPDVEAARERVAENPRSAAALRALATALQNDNRSAEAVPVLERYSRLTPKDTEALNELATLYQAKAARLRGEAQLAQLRVQAAAPETDILPASTTPLGKALGDLPISSAVAGAAQTEFNTKVGEMQAAYRQAQQVYERVVVLKPNDAAAQRELGYAALYASDNATAEEAFKQYLELAPDDPEAPLIRQQLKQIQQAATATTSTPVGGSPSG
jgi:tetratricopeptide (TPR) repeat protein